MLQKGKMVIGRRRFCVCACAANFAPARAHAQAVLASAGLADPALVEDLVAANRILFDQGVVDGFGHVSARHDKDPSRFLLSRSMAPGLVTADGIMEFDLDGNPVDARGRAVYLERFIRGEIFRLHPAVMSVMHSHSPAVIPFGVSRASLKPIYHMSGFLGAGAPVFEIRDAGGPATDMLIRNRELGRALATALGEHPVMLMRGHGSVVVGPSIRESVFRAVDVPGGRHRGERPHRERGPAAWRRHVPERTGSGPGHEDQRRPGEPPWELWRKKAMESR